jgi:hypothetical protein
VFLNYWPGGGARAPAPHCQPESRIRAGSAQLAELQQFNFFPEEDLLAWGNILGRLQSEASLRLLEILHDRLTNDAFYYDRLCLQRERETEDPNDVPIAAEQRKREPATEQQRQERKDRQDRQGRESADE